MVKLNMWLAYLFPNFSHSSPYPWSFVAGQSVYVHLVQFTVFLYLALVISIGSGELDKLPSLSNSRVHN